MLCGVDWKRIWEGVLIAVFVGAVLGGLALFWNWASQGGLIHVLGGVTSKEVEDLIKKVAIVGPQGPAGPQGQIGISEKLPKGAVVGFDRLDGCPEGWTLLRDAVGAANVGSGTPIDRNTKGILDVPKKDVTADSGWGVAGGDSHGFVAKSTRPQRGSEYGYSPNQESNTFFPFYGVKTARIPTFLPLYYCKITTN